MSELTTTNQAEIVERVVLQGDLAQLSPDDRIQYYRATCESLGLNPLTKPFDYIKLNGKLTLYAKRDATDQLRSIHKISVNITSRDMHNDAVYVVSAKARTSDGREDESTGAVSIKGLQGDQLANALMKAETKAKRRVTLSIVGLGWIDETEVETVPSVEFVDTEPTDNGIIDISPGDWTPSLNEFKAQCEQDFNLPFDNIKTILKDHCGFSGFKTKDATNMYNCLADHFAKQRNPEAGKLFDDTETEAKPVDALTA